MRGSPRADLGWVQIHCFKRPVRMRHDNYPILGRYVAFCMVFCIGWGCAFPFPVVRQRSRAWL
jgi:hypothetical protein